MALVWFTGLESGNVRSADGGEFDILSNGGGGNPSADAVTVRTGAYALKVPHDGLVRHFVVGTAATTFIRFYLRVASNPTNSVEIFASSNSTSGASRAFRVWLRSDGKLGVGYSQLAGGTIDDSGANAITLGAWNLVEVMLTRDVAVGGMEVKLNGVTQVSSFTHSTTSGTSATQMRIFFGNDLNQPGTNQSGVDIYFDDIAVATGAYAAPGGVVKIQGKAGSPTYDTWTKSGGATAAECWSETPFSAAKNCSHNVVGDRQTMLIDDAAVDAAIGASDVINGAYVFAVGKIVTSGSVKLTRRIGGVDTDTAAFSLTTTDLRIPEPVNSGTNVVQVFTPTRAELEAGEIGAVANSTNQVTIEDLWLMVDVTVSTPEPEDGTPLEVDFVVAYDALTVAFMVAEVGLIAGLNVKFDVVGGGPEESVGLTVRFEVYGAPEPGLTVFFGILPAGLVERRFSSDVQGPVADVDLS